MQNRTSQGIGSARSSVVGFVVDAVERVRYGWMGDDGTMPDSEQNLKRYLHTENLINAFFRAFDYCLPRCIRPAIYAAGGAAVAACCKKQYYCLYDLDHPAYDLLRREREVLYGTPQALMRTDAVSPCEYHHPLHGCVLSTHKSPVCLAFLCREGIDGLRDGFGIFGYDYLGVYYALEWILTGDLPEGHYVEFHDTLRAMTHTLKGKGRSGHGFEPR